VETLMDGFAVGDRVTRQLDVFTDSILRHGLVVERYAARTSHQPILERELYAVKWDDTQGIERGYFRHGLTLEMMKHG
jgi:hypothetical protein